VIYSDNLVLVSPHQHRTDIFVFYTPETGLDPQRKLQALPLVTMVDPSAHLPYVLVSEKEIPARRPAVKVVLTRRHRQARLEWARAHLRFTRVDWANVLFSDETRFNDSGNDGSLRVYRSTHERVPENCVVGRNRFSGGSVMIWAGISFHHKTPAVVIQGTLTARRYCDDVL